MGRFRRMKGQVQFLRRERKNSGGAQTGLAFLRWAGTRRRLIETERIYGATKDLNQHNALSRRTSGQGQALEMPFAPERIPCPPHCLTFPSLNSLSTTYVAPP